MTADVVGIIVFVGGLILYYATKKQYTIFLWISGVGAGMVIAAIWIMVQIQLMDFSQFFE